MFLNEGPCLFAGLTYARAVRCALEWTKTSIRDLCFLYLKKNKRGHGRDALYTTRFSFAQSTKAIEEDMLYWIVSLQYQYIQYIRSSPLSGYNSFLVNIAAYNINSFLVNIVVLHVVPETSHESACAALPYCTAQLKGKVRPDLFRWIKRS